MNIADFCIKHRVTTILAFVIVAIFGVYSYFGLPLALLPDMEVPTAIVYVNYYGAGPQDIAELVTRPLESAIASVAGVKKINSTSADSMSTLTVSFEDGIDLDKAISDMKDKLKSTQSTLPEDCSSPTVIAINMDMIPVTMFALQGSDLGDLQSMADDNVVPALERIDGVASVDVYGGYTSEVVVSTDSARMQEYGLSISYLSQILSANNLLYPGGSVDNGSQTLSAHTDGRFTSLDDVRNAVIPLPTGGTICLSDVADVYMAPEGISSMAKVNDTNCVLLAVNKQSGTNTAKAATETLAEMEALQQQYPTLQYVTVFDQSDYIHMSMNQAVVNIILGVIIAAIVLFVFLRRFGATVTIAISMPVCIVTVFLCMNALDVTLNMMSLGGVTLGVGMIVDNSIVVLENIFQKQGDGYGRLESCVEGTKEVTLAIVASTLTTVAVFLPLAFTTGIVGQMFRDFSLTIVILLLSSLAIALTLVPLLCYFLLDPERTRQSHQKTLPEKKDAPAARILGFFHRLFLGYQKALNYFISHRLKAVLIAVGMTVVMLLSLLRTNATLIPEMDQSSVSVTVSMPIGSELDDSAAIADRICTISENTIPEMEDVYYQVEGTTINLGVKLVPIADRHRSAKEICNQLRLDLADIAGCEITVSTSDMMNYMTSSDINVVLTGPDYDTLVGLGSSLQKQIAALPDATDVSSSAEDQVPQITVHVNSANAARFGLTAATIGTAVRAELNGSTATKMTMSGKEYSISIKGDETSSSSVDALKSMLISTATGGSVPLALVADVEVELAPTSITRTNQNYSVTITGSSVSGNTTALTKQIYQLMDQYPMPDGYFIESDSSYEDMMSNFGSLGLALVVALGLIYFILASQFESFVMPVIIMMIIPIAFSGGLFGLPVTGKDLSAVSILGIIILAGTVVNASIVLVDAINQRRRFLGEDKKTAILNACPRRVRPVLMTTLTTILGLMPMATATGEGSELMSPMGIVMIFGMTFATIVTLFFTPVFYSLIDSLTARFSRKRETGEDPAAVSSLPLQD